jgi:hypothetical protein
MMVEVWRGWVPMISIQGPRERPPIGRVVREGFLEEVGSEWGIVE